jgi:4-hydroxybenzoate polyprenyltransferase
VIRYLEYVYLVAAVGLTVFLALSFQTMPTANKVLFGFGIALCAFMFSFRRKQRQVMEDIDRQEDEAEENEDSPKNDN